MNDAPDNLIRPAGRSGSVFPIVLIYVVLGGLWILLSDQVVATLFHDPEQVILISTVKGWLYIVFTAVLLYALIRRQLVQLQDAHRHELELYIEQQHSLRLLAAIARASTDMIFAKNLSGKYTLFNEAACASAGKSIDQVLGYDDTVVFPAQAEVFRSDDREVMTEGRGKTIELLFETAQQGLRTLLVTKGPLRDSAGRVMGVFGLCRDITDRKLAEEELRANEARFRALVEQSAAGIYIVQDDRFQYVNPYLARLAGYDTPDQLIGSVSIADLIAPHQRSFVAEQMARRIAGDSAESHYEFTGIRRDGGRVELELYGNLLMYRNRPAMIGLLIDITERKRAERELKQRNQELERINQAMVGRELVMIEMKRDVNRLSRLLGREEPYALDFLDETETSTGESRS